MCVTNHHDITLAVKVALNSNTTNQLNLLPNNPKSNPKPLAKQALVFTCLQYKSFTKQEGYDGPVSLHWLIREIPSYQTLQYVGIGLKQKTPNKD